MPTTAAAAADKPEPKPKPKTGLSDAAASTDPAVQKLLWDRGHRESSVGDVASIDAELRKLGYDI